MWNENQRKPSDRQSFGQTDNYQTDNHLDLIKCEKKINDQTALDNQQKCVHDKEEIARVK